VRACERLGVWFVLRFELGGRWAMCRCGTLVAATALNFFKKNNRGDYATKTRIAQPCLFAFRP
jgi:hypothetical protein